jgi:signal transduction histidine kinase
VQPEIDNAKMNMPSQAGSSNGLRFSSNPVARITRYVPYLLGVGSLFLIFWAGIVVAAHPNIGFDWSYTTGVVFEIDPLGPAAGLFRVGDRILTIDGLTTYEARRLPGYRASQSVAFVIEREGEVLPVSLELAVSDFSRVLRLQTPLLAASLFCILGLLVYAFGPTGRTVRFFFLFNLCFSLLLATGTLSSIGPLWSGWAFSIILWWIGPLFLHTHLLLAELPGSPKRERLLVILYSLALVFSSWDFLRLYQGHTSPLMVFKMLWIVSAILASVWVLIYSSRKSLDPECRRKTRIAGLAAFTAFLPFIVLSYMPYYIFDRYILSYEISFMALPILPLGYSYSILRYKLIPLERYISRAAAYTLVVLVLAAIYGMAHIATLRTVRAESQLGFLDFFIVITLILLFQPLNKQFQRWVNQLFYGGWYDDRAATRQISQAITNTRGDTHTIALILCQTLQKTLQLEYAHLLLNDGRLVTSQNLLSQEAGPGDHFPIGSIMSWFQKLEAGTGRKMGPGKELVADRPALDFRSEKVLGPKPHFWLLLDGRTCYQGLLVLGERRGGSELNQADLEILEVVIRQAGAALENECLLQELRFHDQQNRSLQRQILKSREQERKRLARELHDNSIQTLVGVNYQIAEVRPAVDGELSGKLLAIAKKVQESISGLRSVCADLRPPALDTLGLIATLQAKIAETQTQVSFSIDTDMEPQFDESSLSEEAALCIYRLVFEGLANVRKHSSAEWALVSIHPTENGITVSVEDDGKGFTPPNRLDLLVGQSHYGLVGLQEQVEMLGGRLIIDSSPGYGCRLSAHLPCAERGLG